MGKSAGTTAANAKVAITELDTARVLGNMSNIWDTVNDLNLRLDVVNTRLFGPEPPATAGDDREYSDDFLSQCNRNDENTNSILDSISAKITRLEGF